MTRNLIQATKVKKGSRLRPEIISKKPWKMKYFHVGESRTWLDDEFSRINVIKADVQHLRWQRLDGTQNYSNQSRTSAAKQVLSAVFYQRIWCCDTSKTGAGGQNMLFRPQSEPFKPGKDTHSCYYRLFNSPRSWNEMCWERELKHSYPPSSLTSSFKVRKRWLSISVHEQESLDKLILTSAVPPLSAVQWQTHKYKQKAEMC